MNLNKEIDFKPADFLHWWGRGLSAWLPEKIRRWLKQKTPEVLMVANDNQLALYRRQDGQETLLARLNMDESLAGQFEHFLDEHPELEQARFLLRLEGRQAIKKNLQLPLAVKDNLEQVMRYELDKYTPFTADQVYYAVKALNDNNGQQLNVLLVITPRATLDSLYDSLSNAGIPLDRVYFKEAPDDSYTPYNLLPEEKRPARGRVYQWLLWGLLGTLLILLGLVLVYPVYYQKQSVEQLRQQLDRLKNQSQQVLAQQQQMDQIIEETEHLIQLKKEAPFLNELLNSLSQLLPENTWLTHFKFSQNRIQIQGQSASASSLIGILENAPALSNVRFVSPLTQDKRTGLERFQISADVNSPEKTHEP